MAVIQLTNKFVQAQQSKYFGIGPASPRLPDIAGITEGVGWVEPGRSSQDVPPAVPRQEDHPQHAAKTVRQKQDHHQGGEEGEDCAEEETRRLWPTLEDRLQSLAEGL